MLLDATDMDEAARELFGRLRGQFPDETRETTYEQFPQSEAARRSIAPYVRRLIDNARATHAESEGEADGQER